MFPDLHKNSAVSAKRSKRQEKAILAISPPHPPMDKSHHDLLSEAQWGGSALELKVI